MKKAIQSPSLLIDAINLVLSHDWKHPGHHCVVSELIPASDGIANWTVDIFNSGGSSLEKGGECAALIERILVELRPKYEVDWELNS